MSRQEKNANARLSDQLLKAQDELRAQKDQQDSSQKQLKNELNEAQVACESLRQQLQREQKKGR